MSVSSSMRERRRKSRWSLYKGVFSLLVCILIMSPAVMVLIKGTPIVVFVAKGEKKPVVAKENRVANKQVRITYEDRVSSNRVSFNEKQPSYQSSPEESPVISQTDLIEPIEPINTKKIASIADRQTKYYGIPENNSQLTLDFELKRQIFLLGEIFPRLTAEEMMQGKIQLMSLESTDALTKVEQPLGGIASGESGEILFPNANRIKITVERDRKQRGGRQEEVIEIKPEVLVNNGNAVALNFDAVQRERRLWYEFAKRGPKSTNAMQPMILSLMSNDALASYNVSSNANQAAVMAANAQERKRRISIAASSLTSLDALESYMISLHHRARLKLVFIKPDLSEVTTTPHGLN